MDISIVDPGLNPAMLWWAGGLVALAVVLFVGAGILSREREEIDVLDWVKGVE